MFNLKKGRRVLARGLSSLSLCPAESQISSGHDFSGVSRVKIQGTAYWPLEHFSSLHIPQASALCPIIFDFHSKPDLLRRKLRMAATNQRSSGNCRGG